MFDKLGKFLQSLAGDEEKPEFTRDDPRVAATALFFHVIDADGVIEASERDKIAQLVQKSYSLDERQLAQLLDVGEQAEDESIDFYAFTSVLKRSLDAEQRVQFIELLWELVYADGVKHELEESVVGRVAELLGVSDRDRVIMRQQAETRTDTEDDG
ncbi:TerB family tellurite resistance protein [Hoeflea sp. CAU 1731]